MCGTGLNVEAVGTKGRFFLNFIFASRLFINCLFAVISFGHILKIMKGGEGGGGRGGEIRKHNHVKRSKYIIIREVLHTPTQNILFASFQDLGFVLGTRYQHNIILYNKSRRGERGKYIYIYI